jgi:hypothetical protein
MYCTIASGSWQSSHSWVEVPQNSRPYFTVSLGTLPTWRDRFPYLYPSETGWPSYTPYHWVSHSVHNVPAFCSNLRFHCPTIDVLTGRVNCHLDIPQTVILSFKIRFNIVFLSSPVTFFRFSYSLFVIFVMLFYRFMFPRDHHGDIRLMKHDLVCHSQKSRLHAIGKNTPWPESASEL